MPAHTSNSLRCCCVRAREGSFQSVWLLPPPLVPFLSCGKERFFCNCLLRALCAPPPHTHTPRRRRPFKRHSLPPINLSRLPPISLPSGRPTKTARVGVWVFDTGPSFPAFPFPLLVSPPTTTTTQTLFLLPFFQSSIHPSRDAARARPAAWACSSCVCSRPPSLRYVPSSPLPFSLSLSLSFLPPPPSTNNPRLTRRRAISSHVPHTKKPTHARAPLFAPFRVSYHICTFRCSPFSHASPHHHHHHHHHLLHLPSSCRPLSLSNDQSS